MSLSAKINKKLAKTRAEQNLTMEKLAELSGMSMGTLCRVENGKANLTISSLETLLDAMGKQLKFKLEDIEEENDE